MGDRMEEETDLSPVILLEDEPVPGYWVDELGLRPFAEVIASAAWHTDGPFTIGVFGKWGEGKTSLLKQAKSLLDERHPEAITVWFNAWQFDHEEHPLVPLALSIAEQVEVEEPESSQGGGSPVVTLREIGQALRAVAYGLKVKSPFIEIAGDKIIDQLDKLDVSGTEALLAPTLYVKAFNLLRGTVKSADSKSATDSQQQRPRIVVFIDDLDRCLPEKALKLLQSIRLAFAQPGFIFVVALDRVILEDYLVREHRRLEVRDPELCGRSYLDKIVQLPVWLPPHRERFVTYIERLLDRPALQAPSNEAVRTAIETLKPLLAIGANANPRSLVRFINNLIVDQRLWEAMEEEVDIELLGLCAVSRMLHEHLGDQDYLALTQNPSLCQELAGEGGDVAEKREWLKLADISPEKRSPDERLRYAVFRRLERASFLTELLQTEFGRRWLTDHPSRAKVEHFLRTERHEPSAPAASGKEAIDSAIRRTLEMPAGQLITDEDRKRVRELDLDGLDIEDADLAQLKALTSLSDLSLSDTQVADAGLEHVRALTALSRLDLNNTQVTDAGLEHVKALTSLSSLSLMNTQVTDAGLEHVKVLTSLSYLYLSGTQVTDAGLEHLKALTSLSYLSLTRTQVTDAGLEHLKALASLSYLSLGGTQVTDAGLEHVKALTSLRWLTLIGTQVTDAGLEHLKALASLARLSLEYTQVTDAGLEHLKALTSLSYLTLIGTQVTDAGLEHLKTLTSLSDLSLSNTQVTDAGCEAFQTALPTVRIHR